MTTTSFGIFFYNFEDSRMSNVGGDEDNETRK